MSGDRKDEMVINAVMLVRQRLYDLARIYDPLYGGEVSVGGKHGSVFLGELSQWIWFVDPKDRAGLRDGVRVLTDEQVAEGIQVQELTRTLLESARKSLATVLRHLKRVENSPDFIATAIDYLTKPGKLTGDIVVANHDDRFMPEPPQLVPIAQADEVPIYRT